MSLNKSTISNNTAELGGVLHMVSSSAVLSSSIFSQNSADSGAVMFAVSESSATIDSSHFTSNTAMNEGGVVIVQNHSGVSVLSSLFYQNTVEYFGALFSILHNSSVQAKYTKFMNNTVVAQCDGTSKCGGAVVSAQNSSSASLFHSEFSGNSASFGGVVCAWKSSSVEMSTSNFTSNTARWGGVVNVRYSSSVTVSTSQFTSNRAGNGGVVSARHSSSVTVSTSQFTSNTARVDGGVVCVWYSSNITVITCNFTSNTAGYGRVVCAWYRCSVTVSTSQFTSNTAQWGGVVYVELESGVTVSTSHFTSNTAGDDGGVVSAMGSSIRVFTSHFTSNTAEDNGGVVSARHSSSVTVSISQFTSNRAGNGGGVVHAEGSRTVIMSVSNFTSNRADTGAVVWAEDSSITFTASDFMMNRAEKMGAVVFMKESNIVMFSGNTEQNIAVAGGSAIFSYDSSVHINHFMFQNNPGTVVVLNQDLAADIRSFIENCEFQNNVQKMISYGVDIFASSVVLQNITVLQSDMSVKFQSITVVDKVIISLLSIVYENGVPSTAASFSKIMWKSGNHTQLGITCPKEMMPSIKFFSTTHEYIGLVEASCQQCFGGYYIGNRSTVTSLSKQTIDMQSCSEVQSQNGSVVFAVCFPVIQGKCYICPHGADCSSGVRALPNYWGLSSQEKEISMTRCPSGYCCEESPCPGIDSCSLHRKGTLCGRCSAGFTEALLSTTCVPNSETPGTWVVWTYVSWIIGTAACLFFMKDLKNLVRPSRQMQRQFGRKNAKKKTQHKQNP